MTADIACTDGRPVHQDRPVLVVDCGVGDAGVLLDGRRADLAVLQLTPDGRPLEQIARYLEGRRGVPALHVLSHGEPGALILAGERVDQPALAARPWALEAIAGALADDASVVLYGCSVAAGPGGRGFLDGLEASLGVAVAASDGPVGAAAKGGRWTLHGRDGVVEPAFAPAARAGFAGLLGTQTGTAGNDTLTGTAGADDISGVDGNDVLSAIDGDDSLFGGAGNDTLYGGGGVDTIYGGAGNDFLYGETGDDLLFGEDGNDGMSGGDGDDTLYGAAGNDTVIGSSGSDLLYGGDGNDWMWGGRGDDRLYGGAGTDTMSGGDGADTLYGEADNDTLSGFSGADLLFGGVGNDVLRGGANADTLSGGDGADTLSGGSGDDVLVGGAGQDLFSSSAANFNGDTISDFGVDDTIVVTGVDLSALNGTAASTTVDLGGGATLTLTGLTSGTFSATVDGGNTTITVTAPSGGGGGDSGGGGSGSGAVVVTDTASDTTGGARTITNTGSEPGSAAIVQNTGNNGNVVTATLPASVTITSEGPSTAQSGSTASDTLITAIDVRNTTGESGAIGGAQGFLNTLPATTPLDVRTIVPTVTPGISTDDPIVITGSANGSQIEAFVIDMRAITGKTLQVNNIEFVSVMGNATVTGGAGNNYAVGDDNAQFLSLGAGDDTLYGGGGNDTIGSADGADLLFGDAGADVVLGGTGNDTLWGGTETDVVYGNQDADVLYGNQAADTLYGGQDNDTAFGGQDNDVAYGNLGSDVVYGNVGADTLFGGQGNDALYGGRDDDVLHGNVGDDTLFGGLGADLFVAAAGGGADVIADFDGAGGDRLQLEANANGTAVDSFDDLQAAASDAPDGGVLIDLGAGNSVTLMGVSVGQLQPEWFVFD